MLAVQLASGKASGGEVVQHQETTSNGMQSAHFQELCSQRVDMHAILRFLALCNLKTAML